MTPPPPPDSLVSALAGRYAIERELGRGGMATVYLARDLRHARKVAVKVLRPDAAAAAGGPRRFLHEIHTIAGLQHPHILGLIDSGELDGGAYYVMPYVEGESLRDRLSREKQLPIADAVRIACEVAAGLDYAHRRGVVHRDVKPENILLQDGQALVADFGIALAVEGDGPTRLTGAGMSIGTPQYMSPEQALGDRSITARSDVYALGAITYEMLLGEPPFNGTTAQAIVAQAIAGRPAPIAPRRATVPEAIDQAVLTALQRVPADRFGSAADFAAALSRAMRAPAGETSGTRGAVRELQAATFRLSEDTCRRISRRSFDPRLIGSDMAYLDNGVASDVVVCWIGACGRGGDQFTQVLRHTKHRSVAPTLRGFEPTPGWRPAFPLEDHIVVLREWLRELAGRLRPRAIVVAGFSSGGDLALRVAAAPDPEERVKIDGCLTLGANLSTETCFLTTGLARLESNDDAALLATLRGVADRASTLNEWVNICEYVTKIVPVFRQDIAPLRAFGAGIAEPFAGEPLQAFAAWYRAAAERGVRLRCVFEDTAMYRDTVRELLIRNLDERLLGDRYEELSVLTDTGADHFDLLDPPRVERHLDALLDRLGVR